MTKPNYTPGPWHWATSNSFTRLSSAEVDGGVISAIGVRSSLPDIYLKNGGANGPDAHLIAAAPDMIEAMKPLVEFIEAFDRKAPKHTDDEFYAVNLGTKWQASIRLSDLRKLRDAYNKARGQSPQSTAAETSE